MKQKKWVLLAMLLLAIVVLSGCGVPRSGVDVTQTDPDGVWQTFVVWPMARSLVWIDGILQDFGVSNNHWGYAIILFTVFIKLITLPLTITQMRGMQAQRELQPKIQELQKKYGKDREKMSQEQMKLYREAGVNPLSGCLPLVVQMPILFGLYSALVALSGNIENSSFYWIPDLGFPRYTEGLSWLPEAFNNGDYGLLAAYLTLPILLMASQYVMQQWMTPSTPAPSGGGSGLDATGMTKQIGTMMTFMFGFFTLQVPAGLSLYWVTSNLLQLLQQWLITSGRIGGVQAAGATAIGGTTSIPSTNGSGSPDGDIENRQNGTGTKEEDDSKEPARVSQKRRRKAKRK